MHDLEARVHRLETLHLGHRPHDEALIAKLEEIKKLVAQAILQGGNMSADLDGIRADVQTIKDNEAAQTAAINDLITRLGNNPTPAEIDAIRADLQAVAGNQTANSAAIASLDPDVPGGAVTP